MAHHKAVRAATVWAEIVKQSRPLSRINNSRGESLRTATTSSPASIKPSSVGADQHSALAGRVEVKSGAHASPFTSALGQAAASAAPAVWQVWAEAMPSWFMAGEWLRCMPLHSRCCIAGLLPLGTHGHAL